MFDMALGSRLLGLTFNFSEYVKSPSSFFSGITICKVSSLKLPIFTNDHENENFSNVCRGYGNGIFG